MCPEIYSGLENLLEFLTDLVVNLISTPIFCLVMKLFTIKAPFKIVARLVESYPWPIESAQVYC